MKIIPFLCCLSIVLFSGCNEIDPKGEKEIPAFVKQWNDTHTQIKAPYLERSYMDVVQYYGVERTKEQIERDKILLFEEFPDYRQNLQNDAMTITKEGGSYLVVFINEVRYNGVEAAYETVLLVSLENSKFKILREGVAENKDYLEDPIFPKNRQKRIASSENRQVSGDFNGDGLSDFAYVDSPVLVTGNDNNEVSDVKELCKGGCTSVLQFSAKDLAPINIENSYKSQLENLKDLVLTLI